MAFKGDVGQISLLNIYQALNLNQQGGILVISSGKDRRKVRFVPQGIRLLSNSPGDPEPLRQILAKLKILTESQFQNVVGTKQSDNGQTIGDFLVQRRLIDPEVVTREIAKHTLDLIYETFFWEPAKYEFTVGDDGDEIELFSPDGPGRYLTFKIEAVLMEVARREDEWARIQDEITDEKEIYIPTDPTTFLKPRQYEAELSVTQLTEIKKLINGKTTIEDIASESTLSKYETYRAFALMIQEGEIRPLTVDEKKALAEKLRKKFKFREVINLYNQLLQEDPDDVEIRLSLVGILEKKKDFESDRVANYQYLAAYFLDSAELDTAKDYLLKTLAIEPYNLEARDMLFEAHVQCQRDRDALAEAKNIIESVKVMKAYAAGAELLEKIVGFYPNESTFYHECAEFHQFNGNGEDAVKNLKLVAGIYERKGDYTRLRKTWERIASIDPSESNTLRRYQEIEKKKSRSFLNLFVPTFAASAIAAVVLFGTYWALMDLMCRNAYAAVSPEVDTLVDNGDFDEATIILNSLQRIYPLSSLRWDIATRVGEISEVKRQVDKQRQIESEQRNTDFTSDLAQITRLLRDRKFADAWEEVARLDRDGLNQKNLEKLGDIEGRLRQVFSESSALLKQAQALTKKGKHNEAHPFYIELLMKYPNTPTARGLEIPLVLRTVPSGAEIWFNGRRLGSSPLLMKYHPFRDFHLRIRKPGFIEFACGEGEDRPVCIDFTKDWSLTVTLKRIPDWTQTLPDQGASPVLAELDRVYVGSRTGVVRCFEQATGNLLWTSESHAALGIQDDLKAWKEYLYFGTTDGKLVVLDRGSGKTVEVLEPFKGKWDARILTSPPTSNGVFVATGGGNALAFKLDGRRTLWATTIPVLLEAPPAIWRDRLLLFTKTGKILSVDVFSGAAKRTINLNSALSWEGTLWEDSLFVCDTQHVIYRIDLRSGEVAWSYRCEQPELLPPVVGEGQVLVASANGFVIALNAEKGTRTWDFNLDDTLEAPGAVVSGRYILGTKKGLVLCIDPGTGTFHWTFGADSGISRRPVVERKKMYTVSDSGTLYSFTMD